jgi:hypothetical protein
VTLWPGRQPRFAVPAWTLASAALLACSRSAPAPLPTEALFPDITAGPMVAVEPGPRTETIAEVEPNDSALQAQPLSALSLLVGSLAATAVEGAKTPRDSDWFRLPATAPGHAVTLDLRKAPACAVLELLDDSGKRVWRKATPWKGTRAVLPLQVAGSGASLVRVTCSGKVVPQLPDAAYELLVVTRALTPSDEWEPNDTVGVTAQPLVVGQPLQATAAPLGDIDRFALPVDSPAGTLWTLATAAVPDVVLRLDLLDPLSGQPVLTRKSAKGEGLLLAGLSPERLRGAAGAPVLVQVTAADGQNPDIAYALSLQSLNVPGCPDLAACAGRVPEDREPNDQPDRAQELPQLVQDKPVRWRGWLDAAGDVDYLSVTMPLLDPPQTAVDQPLVVAMALTAPADSAVGIDWLQGDRVVRSLEARAGTTVRWPGLAVAAGTYFRVRTLDGKRGSSGLYGLELTRLDGSFFEVESTAPNGRASKDSAGREGGPLAEVPGGALDCKEGGWARRGVLHDAADRDRFVLDVPAGSDWTGRDPLSGRRQARAVVYLDRGRGYGVGHVAAPCRG